MSVDDHLFETRNGLGLERHRCGHHEVQEDPQGPYIHGWAEITVVVEQFGGGVRRRSAECPESLAAVTDLDAESEVSDFDSVGAREEYVFGFQVSVDYVVPVLKLIESN